MASAPRWDLRLGKDFTLRGRPRSELVLVTSFVAAAAGSKMAVTARQARVNLPSHSTINIIPVYRIIPAAERRSGVNKLLQSRGYLKVRKTNERGNYVKLYGFTKKLPLAQSQWLLTPGLRLGVATEKLCYIPHEIH